MVSDRRDRQVSDIAERLKMLARELNIPIVVSVELSRTPGTRLDKRPQLDDFGEQDVMTRVADLVLLIYPVPAR